MSYVPVGNNLFVEPLHRTRSAGGIHLLNDNVNSGDPMEFKVLAVGPGRLNRRGERVPIWPEIQPNDVVISPALAAKAFDVLGHTVRVLDAREVLAVVSYEPTNS